MENRLNFSSDGKDKHAYLHFGINVCVNQGKTKENFFENLEKDCAKKNGQTHILQYGLNASKKYYNAHVYSFHNDDSLSNILTDIISPHTKSLGTPIETETHSVLDKQSLSPKRDPFLIIVDTEQSDNCTNDFSIGKIGVLFAQARALGVTIVIHSKK